MQTAYNAPGRSGPGASSNVRVPMPGGDARRNWIATAQLASALAGQTNGLQNLRDQLATLKQIARRLDTLHPFKIYQLPDVLRVTPNPATDWLKFLIRAGNVLGTNATGTDAQDTDPDAEIYPPTATDITVPAKTAKYWFWLEIDTGATPVTAIVRHGTDPTDDSYAIPWDTDPDNPVPDANHITIGCIDTLTHAADCTPIVRQLLREDIVSVGSSAPTRMVVKEVHGAYLTCRTVTGYSTDIQVAKPFSLRRGEIDPGNAYAIYLSQIIEGVRVDFSAQRRGDGTINLDCQRYSVANPNTNPSSAQIEIVLPVWLVDDEILAIIPNGGTGVKTIDDHPVPVTWQALEDGRAWCQVLE